ncbi:SufD family Fe-S cluster assembly protein [Candidatus Peregrinibacteria bacterium]|nr:SufD family Fe-S cluster assembly protein [Candidatus Peregrinibacteria bacterium]
MSKKFVLKNLITHEETGFEEFPSELVIPEGSEQLLFCSAIRNGTVQLREGAKLTVVFVGSKGWPTNQKMIFDLVGRNTDLTFLGFVVGLEKESFPFETISNHIAQQTKAHYYLRAAMFGASNVDYQGKLLIKKSAQLADTYLAHHTLLLSDESRARTIPALEIEADDVKAGHAATIGKVDKDLMFYLLSRGISREQAEELLIHGFFETQVRMIPEEATQTFVREMITKLLPSHQNVVV